MGVVRHYYKLRGDILMASGVCYHHPTQPSVANCKQCGKGICKDCYDSYGAGMGAGKALCFNCTEAMVKDSTNEIELFNQRVKSERLWMIIGMIAGAIFGIIAGAEGGFGGAMLGLLFGVAIGGSLKTIGSVVLDKMFNGESAIDFFIVVGYIMGSPIITAVRFFKRINQIKQCDEILADDARILQSMRDYFVYTQTMAENAETGVDLAALADQGGVLFGNTYASTVINKGEQAAQAELRQGAVTIAANGEIVRSLAPPIKKKKGNQAA